MSLERLAEIDDQLGGHAPRAGGRDEAAGELTPEMADLRDSLLLVRMAAEGEGQSASRLRAPRIPAPPGLGRGSDRRLDRPRRAAYEAATSRENSGR